MDLGPGVRLPNPTNLATRLHHPPDSGPDAYDDDLVADLVEEASRHVPKRRPTCRFYAKGTCNRGDKCTFKHDGVKESTSISHDRKCRSTTPCKFFLRGTCLKGEECPFQHADTAKADSTSGPQQPVSLSPIVSGASDWTGLDFGSLEGSLKDLHQDRPSSEMLIIFLP